MNFNSYCNVTLTGIVSNELEISEKTNGSKYAKMRIITTESKIDKNGEEYLNDTLHYCKAWWNKAEFIDKNVEVGDLITVFGDIQKENYEDGNGDKIYSYFIKVSNVTVLQEGS